MWMSKPRMNLLLAGNDAVYIGMELAVYTTLFHNKGIDIHIFTMDIDITDGIKGCHYTGLLPWQKTKLKKIVAYLDPTSRICFYDVEKEYHEYLEGNANEWSNFTPYALLRLLADVCLPYIDHILYLDCDVAVTGDISDMYWSYLGKGHMYCASICSDACNYEGEMVSGVLLMNLRKMREEHFLEHARENVMKNVYKYPDQDAIRDVGNPYPLPETYGYLYDLALCPYMPVILHFTNQLSPKIYGEKGHIYFYRKFPFLKYVKEGVERLDTISISV